MHFQFLTEDQSSAKAIKILIPKLLGSKITYNIHPYKGIGHIPKGLCPKSDASKRILLDQLPKILRGYGRTPHCGTIVIICDLDDKDKNKFSAELHKLLSACDPKPVTIFCLAIEEFEAWYLGDLAALKKAYPKAKDSILTRYKNDSICGTWELLADAVYKGGSKALMEKGWQAVGEEKSVWAKTITPHMNVENNRSPSFRDMCMQLRSATKND
ncbi:MAG: DUF4276 family protein [Syntrophobacterales bacterium]|jgi:hypothetical protein|nr:DUF4276 family protein [Syntrophobacterales bacterium]